MHHYI